MENSFLSPDELKLIGLASFGENVLISRTANFYSAYKMHLGNNVRIDDYCVCSGRIHIGNNVHIGSKSSLISGKEPIIFEDFSGVSHNCTVFSLTDVDSDGKIAGYFQDESIRGLKEKKVVFCSNSGVGANCVILPGAKLSEGSMLSPLSVLSRKTEKFSVYLGNPAVKVLDRERF